jgi:hypothetical protein
MRDHADHGPVVIDVKPEHLLTNPAVAYTFAWTRRLMEARDWQYEVWNATSEVPCSNAPNADGP